MGRVLAGEPRVPPKPRCAARVVARACPAIVVALSVTVSACQPCGTCDLSTLNTRLISGTVMTSMGDNPPMQFTLSPGGGASVPAGCFLSAATVVGPDNQVQASHGPILNCQVNGVPILLYLTPLDDLRPLKAGIGRGMVNVVEPGSGDSTCTKAGSVMTMVEYDVTRADGGSAGYPMLVTSDYVRDVSVHFMITLPTSCGPLSVAGDIELAQKASDVRQNSGCSCE
jgi:hypothetical protein